MKLTNEEKDIIKMLIIHELDYYENEEDIDAKDFTRELKTILKKLDKEANK